MFTDQPIPFELHITTAPLPVGEMAAFIDFCQQQEAKPLLIELARGEYIHQPMFNKVVFLHSLPEALEIATAISEKLGVHQWPVKRLKIEIPAFDASLWQPTPGAFEPYFEWHGKIQGESSKPLLQLCEKHGAHLSINALKKEEDFRFVTLREYNGQQTFQQRINALFTDLQAAGWPVVKEVSEFCVYDNNVYLDRGWLLQ